MQRLYPYAGMLLFATAAVCNDLLNRVQPPSTRCLLACTQPPQLHDLCPTCTTGAALRRVGVHEGVIQYFSAHGDSTRLAPFFLGANKLYVTTKSFHARMLQAMVEDPIWRDACTSQPFCIEAPGVNGGNLAKFQLTGWGIAVTEHRAFDEGKVLAYWKQLLSSA